MSIREVTDRAQWFGTGLKPTARHRAAMASWQSGESLGRPEVEAVAVAGSKLRFYSLGGGRGRRVSS